MAYSENKLSAKNQLIQDQLMLLIQKYNLVDNPNLNLSFALNDDQFIDYETLASNLHSDIPFYDENMHLKDNFTGWVKKKNGKHDYGFDVMYISNSLVRFIQEFKPEVHIPLINQTTQPSFIQNYYTNDALIYIQEKYLPFGYLKIFKLFDRERVFFHNVSDDIKATVYEKINGNVNAFFYKTSPFVIPSMFLNEIIQTSFHRSEISKNSKEIFEVLSESEKLSSFLRYRHSNYKMTRIDEKGINHPVKKEDNTFEDNFKILDKNYK